VLLVFGAPHKHRLLVGREHGRTIPLPASLKAENSKAARALSCARRALQHFRTHSTLRRSALMLDADQRDDGPPSGDQGAVPWQPPLSHLIVDVCEEMIEILDPNETETRIFHIGHDVERDGQGSRKKHHMYPAVPCARGHTERGEQ